MREDVVAVGGQCLVDDVLRVDVDRRGQRARRAIRARSDAAGRAHAIAVVAERRHAPDAIRASPAR